MGTCELIGCYGKEEMIQSFSLGVQLGFVLGVLIPFFIILFYLMWKHRRDEVHIRKVDHNKEKKKT